MPETQTPTPGKIVAAGKPVAGSYQAPTVTPPADNGTPPAGTPPATTPPADNGTPPAAAGTPPVELNDDQLKEFMKSKGIEGFESLDDLKTKLTKANTPAPVEPTPEEKAAKEAAFEKRMVDHFMSHGGTVEQFAIYKELAKADVKELSNVQFTRELKAAGFNDEEIADIKATRYYMQNPDELIADATEDPKDFEKRKESLKKKNAYFGSKLENRSSYQKSQAEAILNGIKAALKSEEDLTGEEAKLSSKIDDHASKINRKINLELGELNSLKVDPVAFEIPQSAIDDVTSVLKDVSKRKQFFFNTDGSLNLDNIMPMMLENQYLRSAIKASYIEGGNRQVEIVKKIFPGYGAHDIGVGGKNNAGNPSGTPGKIASAGKPQRVGR
jgi:hypothetical protein